MWIMQFTATTLHEFFFLIYVIWKKKKKKKTKYQWSTTIAREGYMIFSWAATGLPQKILIYLFISVYLDLFSSACIKRGFMFGT